MSWPGLPLGWLLAALWSLGYPAADSEASANSQRAKLLALRS